MGSPRSDARRNDKAPKPARRMQRMLIAELRPHPMQAELFSDLSEAELKELAADLRKNGLVNPVEVLPDGTIVAGHQRVRAAKLLEWKLIDCWIRTDLAETGAAAIEERLVMDNLHRRQMTMLERARCYRRLRELAHGDDYWSRDKIRGDLRDYIAQQFGVSGRTLDRWERVLDAPKAIQDAVNSGALPMALAGKAAGLSAKTQDQIAVRFANGENPRAVVMEFLGGQSPRPPKLGTAVHHLAKELAHAHRDLSGRVDHIESCLPDDVRGSLRKGLKLIRRLISRDDANRAHVGNSDECLLKTACSSAAKAAAPAKQKRRAK